MAGPPPLAAIPGDEDFFAFIDSLRDGGYRLVPQQIAGALAVVRRFREVEPEAGERLAYALTPILAHNPREQEDLYRRLHNLGLAAVQEGPVEPDRRPPSEPPAPVGGRIWPYAVAALSAALLLCLLGYWQSPASHGDVPQPPPDPLVLTPPEPIRGMVVPPIYYALRAAMIVVPLALFAAWWRLRRLWRRQIAGGADDEAFLDPLDIGRKTLARGLYEGRSLIGIAQHWRRFRRVKTRLLDEERTIERTIERGGIFTPVYRTKPLSPEYTLLVQEESRHDHVARLTDNLLDRFEREGVRLERYYYRGDIETLRTADDEAPTSTPLDKVESNGRSTLVLIGSSSVLFEPLTGRPKARSWRGIERWPERALLSTSPMQDWGEPEANLLEGGFALGTARECGLRALGEHAARGFRADERLLEGRMVSAAPVRRAAASKPQYQADLLAALGSALHAAAPADAAGAAALAAAQGHVANGEIAEALETIEAAQSQGLLDLAAPRLLAALRALIDLGSTASAKPPREAPPFATPPPDVGGPFSERESPSPVDDFLNSLQDEDSPRVLILSGAPGSGKTSLVRRTMNAWSKRGGAGMASVFVSASRFREPVDLLDHLADELGWREPPGAHEKRELSDLLGVEEPTLVVLDDLDRVGPELLKGLVRLAGEVSASPWSQLRLLLIGGEEMTEIGDGPELRLVQMDERLIRGEMSNSLRERFGRSIDEWLASQPSLEELSARLRDVSE